MIKIVHNYNRLNSETGGDKFKIRNPAIQVSTPHEHKYKHISTQ